MKECPIMQFHLIELHFMPLRALILPIFVVTSCDPILRPFFVSRI